MIPARAKPSRQVWMRFRRKKTAVFGLAGAAAFVIVALFAPLLALFRPAMPRGVAATAPDANALVLLPRATFEGVTAERLFPALADPALDADTDVPALADHFAGDDGAMVEAAALAATIAFRDVDVQEFVMDVRLQVEEQVGAVGAPDFLAALEARFAAAEARAGGGGGGGGGGEDGSDSDVLLAVDVAGALADLGFSAPQHASLRAVHGFLRKLARRGMVVTHADLARFVKDVTGDMVDALLADVDDDDERSGSPPAAALHAFSPVGDLPGGDDDDEDARPLGGAEPRYRARAPPHASAFNLSAVHTPISPPARPPVSVMPPTLPSHASHRQWLPPPHAT